MPLTTLEKKRDARLHARTPQPARPRRPAGTTSGRPRHEAADPARPGRQAQEVGRRRCNALAAQRDGTGRQAANKKGAGWVWQGAQVARERRPPAGSTHTHTHPRRRGGRWPYAVDDDAQAATTSLKGTSQAGRAEPGAGWARSVPASNQQGPAALAASSYRTHRRREREKEDRQTHTRRAHAIKAPRRPARASCSPPAGARSARPRAPGRHTALKRTRGVTRQSEDAGQHSSPVGDATAGRPTAGRTGRRGVQGARRACP